MWQEEQDRGFTSNVGKFVCTNCFDEYALKQFIKEHSSYNYCSYCEETDEEIIACELDSLIEHILESIQYEWGHPANEGLPYETREGGWQVASVYDTWEIIDEVGLGNYHGEIYDDICKSIHNQEWCERDPFSLKGNQILMFGWQKFSEFVCNTARYVFFKANNTNYDRDQHDEMNPVDILDTLATIIKKLDLFEIISDSTIITRTRIVNPEVELISAKQLGSPPNQFANMANRMSPAGIPMFYGAFDVETAIKETYELTHENKKAICGMFKPTRPLIVIDLSKKSYVPSLFDEHERSLRNDIKFLIDFITDFTKPIERSDRAHIDYVPTQIVTEYIRHVFRTEGGGQIDGVVYPSSKNEGKNAIVIFANSEQCIEQTDVIDSGSLLTLIEIKSQELKGG